MLPRGYTIEIVKGGGLEGPRGILFITLIEAQHLPKTDTFSKTDCYVRCSCCCVSRHHGLALLVCLTHHPSRSFHESME